MEDVGHAFIDIQAALQGVRSDLSFTRMDLERMANTFIRHVWNGSLEAPSFRYYIDGEASKLDAERGWRGWGFLYLAGYDYRIWESIAAYFEKEISIQAWPAHVAATAAMLAITDAGLRQVAAGRAAARRSATHRKGRADFVAPSGNRRRRHGAYGAQRVHRVPGNRA